DRRRHAAGRALRAASGDLRVERALGRVRANELRLRRARGEGPRAHRQPRRRRERRVRARSGARRSADARRVAAQAGAGGRRPAGVAMMTAANAWLPDLRRSVDNLLVHKLRSLLTMLGMIFGVAAVLSMLSIGAGAQQQVMAFIEDLGVRNLIVEAKEATDWQQLQKIRQQSPGLTFHDVRSMQATVEGVDTLTPRKRFTPTKVMPKPQNEMPIVYGVEPNYIRIGGLRITAGRFFSEED